MNAKKSVLCLIACLLGSPAEAQDAPAEKAARQPSTEDRFEVRNLEGWTLYINRDVPKQYPEQTAKTLEHLGWELYQIKLAAPAVAVRNMQENNAILMESYFLVNDHYPFIRCELKDQDSAGYALIAALWEGNPRR